MPKKFVAAPLPRPTRLAVRREARRLLRRKFILRLFVVPLQALIDEPAPAAHP